MRKKKLVMPLNFIIKSLYFKKNDEVMIFANSKCIKALTLEFARKS